jgi:hypothetical protein
MDFLFAIEITSLISIGLFFTGFRTVWAGGAGRYSKVLRKKTELPILLTDSYYDPIEPQHDL